MAILLGRALLENGDHQGAITVLEPLIDDAADPASAANARLALAKVYAVQDNYAEMESKLAPLLEHRDVRVLAARSVAQWFPERPEQAEEYISRVLIVKDQPDPRVLHVLANVMAIQPNAGDRRDTIRDRYRKAASDAAIAAQVYSDWGTFESRQNQPAEAEAAFRKALALRPERPVTLNNLAWSLAEQPSGLSEAVELIDKAIRVAPWRAELHHTRGQILFKQKRHEAAVTAYRRAEAIGKQDADLYGDLARAYAVLGDVALRDDAVRQFGGQLDLDVKDEKMNKLSEELEALAPQK